VTLLAVCALALPLPAAARAPFQEPPEMPVPAEPAEPAQPPAPTGPLGFAALLDDRSILDRLELRLSGLTPPPPGATYRVWLRSDDLALAEAAGDLPVDETGTAVLAYTQPAGEALFTAFSQVLVTLESGPPAKQPGPIVLAGAVDTGAITQFRRLLVRWPDSRYGTASLQGLRQLALNARFQAAVLREAAVNGDLPGMRRKAEHLVNLVEGSRGGSFGDLDGNGRAEDPGDGVGLIPYIWGALTQTQFAWATAADDQIAQASLAVQPPLQYALAWAGFVRDAGVELTRAQDPGGGPELSEHLFTAIQRIIAAVDPGQDTDLRALLAETDLTPAYQSALSLIQVPLVPPAATTVVSSTPGGSG